MKKATKGNTGYYFFRFASAHIIAYTIISVVFLIFQNMLPESSRLALELYQPFRSLSLLTIIGQVLRGLASALVFLPFYHLIFNKETGKVLLFLSMWGLALVGSVEPQPGSIEGVIYTLTTFTEHASVLIAVALQMLIFVWLIFMWEAKVTNTNSMKQGENNLFPNREKLKGYTIRFMVVHLITYWIVGMIFYEIAGYADTLETMEIFELWRPLENLPAVFLVFFGQIFRGALLGLLLYPFYHNYIEKKHGWLLLYLLLAGLTILGSPLFITEFIAFEGTFSEFLKDLVVGIPEIFSQMLIFSVLFFLWQRKVEKKQAR